MERHLRRRKWSTAVGLFGVLITLGMVTTPAASQAPEQNVINDVDILFLFDDTVSFDVHISAVGSVFETLVTELETTRPDVEFGFGVARFEDYGGLGWDFCSGVRPCEEDEAVRITGRPFILNQPIITAAAAGGATQRNQLLAAAFGRQAPGFGGDDPESALADGLFQAATGIGFDGNGDGLMTGLAGDQTAGALVTQTSPDTSGDVPPFSSLQGGVLAAGTIGGAGFREEALKLIVLATDICSAAAFPAGTVIPGTIEGRFSVEETADFACSETTPGVQRFGFVANAKSAAGNTVAGAVVPLGAASLEETIGALNQRGIRVVGLAPKGEALPAGSGPSFEPSVFLSALARITGAVGKKGNPLVFDLAAGADDLKQSILDSILISADSPNPGCEDRNLGLPIESIGANLQQQEALAKRASKFFRRSGMPKKKVRRKRTRMEELSNSAGERLNGFPRSVTVCASLACDNTDRSQDVNDIQKASRQMFRQVRAAFRAMKRDGQVPKRLRKMRKEARKVFRENGELIEQLPRTTSDCPAASF